MNYTPMENSQSFSCTISTDNNNSAKTLESKHPKFMRTIEESGQHPPNHHQVHVSSYNTVLSSTMNKQKSTALLGGLATLNQAQYESKGKQKIPSQASVGKKQGVTLGTSNSVAHFKSPSQQIQGKKGSTALAGSYK
mmetsp:Transcript_39581/g.38105  ORF Transcript_39581/g.38105 Transcript_39581/m.38105 type:complete len:137 (-) Transcript_39581:49-459(-)